MNSYLDECLQSLSRGVQLLSGDEYQLKKKQFCKRINFVLQGVDWSLHSEFVEVSERELFDLIDAQTCYVMWDEYSLPILKANYIDLLTNIDDVLAVAFDTWFIGEQLDWLIEFHHEGIIRFTRL